MPLQIDNSSLQILVEPQAFEGIRRIAGTLARDIETVTGFRPPVSDSIPEDVPCVVCMTLGHSPEAERLMDAGILDRAALTGKREIYQIRLTEGAAPRLLICGSDKRGTIYGMFSLSEYLGVSPLCFWGDATPVQRQNVQIRADIECISREPAVKYRGFFINDEWPCFGTWATERFGGINADCYESVFELLLRMKGNYLWPAMWRSSFPLDGPGSANEELADLYGVIMCYSHHEPCLRASEEWDLTRGPDSVYGNEWNYYTNEPGLLRYWEDALKRSGKYENMITIGMRGERDSSMLGPDATLAENISLLKRIITEQRRLIRQHVPRKAPQMLALYKEVERYFYGDEQAEGLKSWQELDDVLFMLCEDNFGHLRTVPPRELRDHPGGWGMYYHLDYHGGPISYEWVDSTPLAQVREQMLQAWEYGIRDLWIVNVGDIKLHEVSLGYFLALACDPGRYGQLQGPDDYLQQWAARSFPSSAPALQEKAAEIYRDFVFMNSLRRPEALNADVYHPVHYGEADRMLAFAEKLEQRVQELEAGLSSRDSDAFFSMVGYPALASANLLKMQLSAAKNHHYAGQGKVWANFWADQTEACIRRDAELKRRFADAFSGKWRGMELESHIGFTRWNDDDARYPVISRVPPMPGSCMKVSRMDSEAMAVRAYGGPMTIPVPDFLDAGCDRVTLEVCCGGDEGFDCSVSAEGEILPPWLEVQPASVTVCRRAEITLICHRELLPREPVHCRLHIDGASTRVDVTVDARRIETVNLPPHTWLPRGGLLVIPADGCCSCENTPNAAFERLTHFGKYGSGMKSVPSDASFADSQPGLRYRFLVEEPGDYRVTLLTAPNNPIRIGSPVRLRLESSDAAITAVVLPEEFRAGENSDAHWCRDVLDQAHRCEVVMHFEAGVQELTIRPLDPGIVPERLILAAPSARLLPSYLGPENSARTEDLT